MYNVMLFESSQHRCKTGCLCGAEDASLDGDGCLLLAATLAGPLPRGSLIGALRESIDRENRSALWERQLSRFLVTGRAKPTWLDVAGPNKLFITLLALRLIETKLEKYNGLRPRNHPPKNSPTDDLDPSGHGESARPNKAARMRAGAIGRESKQLRRWPGSRREHKHQVQPAMARALATLTRAGSLGLN
ncbi:uncharacterized protein VTP21DRAFT_881 [Calcarisporiella thermophila]|uniref:uncharacterized protein n=1 Tax=Calcarisporiella thermophila TaxID=911321 RepID=UPI00374255CF